MPIKLTRRTVSIAVAFALAGRAGSAVAQIKWDLPAAYPATHFHTENLVWFAADVDKATAGKLMIAVHANASLFKAPEIKPAVQGGQAQIDDILLPNFQNEWQIFGVVALPFLADRCDASAKLHTAQKPALVKKLGGQGRMVLYAVAWPPRASRSEWARSPSRCRPPSSRRPWPRA